MVGLLTAAAFCAAAAATLAVAAVGYNGGCRHGCRGQRTRGVACVVAALVFGPVAYFHLNESIEHKIIKGKLVHGMLNDPSWFAGSPLGASACAAPLRVAASPSGHAAHGAALQCTAGPDGGCKCFLRSLLVLRRLQQPAGLGAGGGHGGAHSGGGLLVLLHIPRVALDTISVHLGLKQDLLFERSSFQTNDFFGNYSRTFLPPADLATLDQVSSSLLPPPPPRLLLRLRLLLLAADLSVDTVQAITRSPGQTQLLKGFFSRRDVATLRSHTGRSVRTVVFLREPVNSTVAPTALARAAWLHFDRLSTTE